MSPDTELEALVVKHVFATSPEQTDACIAWGPHKIGGWSTCMAKAWRVVEAMQAHGFWLTLYRTRRRTYVWFTPHNKHYDQEAVTHAETAPRAICLAALAALEVTNEPEP